MMKSKAKSMLVVLLALAMAAVFMPALPGAAADAAVKKPAPAVFYGLGTSPNTIKLTWSRVSGAKSYVVYRNGRKYRTTRSRTLQDKKVKKGKIYRYAVKASSGKSSYTIKVKAAKTGNVKSLKLSSSKVTLKEGASKKLTVSFSPSKKLISKKVVWSTSRKSVAAVSGKGVVTAGKQGTATIKARAVNGRTATCTVKVITANPAKDDIDKLTANIDESYAREVAYTLAYDEKYFDSDEGFRNAGSDAEHRAANYLKKQFDKIGLVDVEKVPVTVDKWQFNEATLSISYRDGEESRNVEIDDMISYPAEGTKQQAAKAENKSLYEDNGHLKQAVVDMGNGYESDYEAYYEKTGEKNMNGKIVLVAVNQWEDSWIDTPYTEAYHQGASAIITYQRPNTSGLAEGGGGYGLLGQGSEKSWDAVNVQDICANSHLIPCTSISPKDAGKIKRALEKDADAAADMYVDSEVVDNGGTSYNVIGKIEGSGNTGQQIVFGGHYDKYFYGLNDDCTAIGLISGVAKAMKDADYQPVNDIYFVAHGSEEWGQSDSADDWAIGSWNMITKAKPEWQGTTLALINFEMPAIKSGMTQGQGVVQTSAELDTMVSDFSKDTSLLNKLTPYYKEGVATAKVEDTDLSNEPSGMSDCISYQSQGVPCVINMPDFDDPVATPKKSLSGQWMVDRYHTKYDNSTTYSKALMHYNIGYYGALAEDLDAKPALELDLGDRCNTMEAALEGTDELADTDQIKAYSDSLTQLRTAGGRLLAKAKAINARYAAACSRGAGTEERQKIIDEGAALNKVSLKAFGDIQDTCMGLVGSDVTVLHQTAQPNVSAMDKVIGDMQAGKVTEEETFDAAASLYGYADATAFSYSDYSCEELLATVNCERNRNTWGWNEGRESARMLPTWKAAKEMAAQYGSDSPDYTKAIKAYQEARADMLAQMNDYLQMETKGMEDVAAAVNTAL